MVKPIVGIYENAVSGISTLLLSARHSFAVFAIQGPVQSGKTSVAYEAMQRSGLQATIFSFSQLVIGGPNEFLTRLKRSHSGIYTGFDDLTDLERSVLVDYITSVRLGIVEGTSRIWLIPAVSRVLFADKEIDIPDLASSPETRFQLCRLLLDSFPFDPECPIIDLIFQSTGKLSLGQLGTLVQSAKTLALSSGTGLSCAHLSQAFHSLELPVSRISIVPESSSHLCEFVSCISTNLKLERFIGLTPENRVIVDSFLEESVRSKLFLISGPIGSGKSHLAAAIAWDPTRPATRVTAADILRSKIGESEKALHASLSSGSRIIIEDLDKLIPEDASEATGSVQRCLAVLVSFLDWIRFGKRHVEDFMVIGTSRSAVDPRLESKLVRIELSNKLSFSQKVELIKSAYPAFDGSEVSEFDLINISNRSACVEFGREKNMERLREVIASRVI